MPRWARGFADCCKNTLSDTCFDAGPRDPRQPCCSRNAFLQRVCSAGPRSMPSDSPRRTGQRSFFWHPLLRETCSDFRETIMANGSDAHASLVRLASALSLSSLILFHHLIYLTLAPAFAATVFQTSNSRLPCRPKADHWFVAPGATGGPLRISNHARLPTSIS